MTISYDDFAKIDIRVGTIVAVDPFPEARKPAYKLTVDFGGDIGTRRSSAQITALYPAELLIGRQILAVVNFPPNESAPSPARFCAWAFPTLTARWFWSARIAPCRTAANSTDRRLDHSGRRMIARNPP